MSVCALILYKVNEKSKSGQSDFVEVSQSESKSLKDQSYDYSRNVQEPISETEAKSAEIKVRVTLGVRTLIGQYQRRTHGIAKSEPENRGIKKGKVESTNFKACCYK